MAEHVVIIGAGVGGLAAAMRLATAGVDVTVVERHPAPGGKMRVVQSLAGPVDCGPTVLTMRPVFEDLFEDCGASLSDHVTLRPLEVLARHHWPDGSSLDLYADAARSQAAIEAFAGARAGQQFARFHRNAETLYRAFEGPMMRSPDPSLASMTAAVARRPWLVPAMAPGKSMSAALKAQFTDPRLQQLFGRYATYVGGNPNASPALLSLIWHAESRGVWAVEGGMHGLARGMQAVAEAAGATFLFGTEARRLVTDGGTLTGVDIGDEVLDADAVVFNGDPRALRAGLLGEAVRHVVPDNATAPRSLSAYVWSFAATATGLPPHHHNVFFPDPPSTEFDDIAAGRMPSKPALYLCAQDRGERPEHAGPERFEIIMNGPPRPGTQPDPEEMARCRETTFETLARMGMTFDPLPELEALTTPESFHSLFPGTDGSLYGLSPHGMMAAFRRPRSRTEMAGLYLAGGGAHPGAGIPMATTSGRHAAEAILQDLASTSPSRRTGMAGGMSTASRRTVNMPSR
jgi:1-hydroxycarotenoid 3,4-desaturase